MYTKIANVITKANVLAKLAKIRLQQPILPYVTPNESLKLPNNECLTNKLKAKHPHLELAAITPAVAALVNVANLLKTGQALSNQQSLTKLVNNTRVESNAKEGPTKNTQSGNILYNLKDQVWNVLKPGDEKRTRHLKWR